MEHNNHKQSKRAASEVMWPICQYPYSGNFLACHPTVFSLWLWLMIGRCLRQFATRILILFYQYSFMRRFVIFGTLLAQSLLFEYSNIPFTMICKTVIKLSHREHEDCTLLTNSTKNLALYQVNITSQIENFIICGANVNWHLWWRKS